MFRLSQVLLEIGFCLLERCFKGLGVDREEKVSLFYILTLCEINAYQFPSHQ